jgi:hypothetical protein
MAITVIIHVANEEPVLGEIESLPEPNDQVVIVNNPRKRDGKELHYIEEEVTMMIVPWHRINFIEVLPSAEMEEVITFVRE